MRVEKQEVTKEEDGKGGTKEEERRTLSVEGRRVGVYREDVGDGESRTAEQFVT